MPLHYPPSPYPAKKDLLIFIRAILDQKPPAIKLAKDVVNQFQTSTLEASLNLARTYLDSMENDGTHP